MNDNEEILPTRQAELDSILDAALDELDDDDDDDDDDVDSDSSNNDDSADCDGNGDGDEPNAVVEKRPIFGPQILPSTTKEPPSPSRVSTALPPSSQKNTLISPEEEAIKDMMRHMEALFPPDEESLKSSAQVTKQTKEESYNNSSNSKSSKPKNTVDTKNNGESREKQTSKKSAATGKGSKKSSSGDHEKMEETMTKLFEQLSQSFEGNGNDFDDDQFPGFDGLGDDFMKEMAKEWESTLSGNGEEGQEEVVGQVVDGMMKQLLSKEFMYEPMKDICDSFPTWLAENKSKLNEKDYEQYGKQYQYFQRIVHVYEHDPENIARLSELMHDIQEFGQPPPELIKKLAPDLELDQNGIPNMDGAGLGPMMNEECCIM